MERQSEIRNEELIWWPKSRCDTEGENTSKSEDGQLKLTKEIRILKRYMNSHVH